MASRDGFVAEAGIFLSDHNWSVYYLGAQWFLNQRYPDRAPMVISLKDGIGVYRG